MQTSFHGSYSMIYLVDTCDRLFYVWAFALLRLLQVPFS
jgi:hypothetical protein